MCAALLLLSGCATRDAQIPDEGILSEAQMQQHYQIDRQWWTQYNEPSLNKLVDMALERNIDLARSAITVNRALYQARQLGAELVPWFSGSGDAGSRTALDSGHATRSFDASFGLSYELDLWGRLRDAASAQSWEFHATEQDREATRLALVNSVVNTWYSMAYTSRALELSRQSLAYYEQLLTIMRNKFQAGQTDGLDPAQTEQSLLAQKTTVLTLEEQLREERQTLRDLLNLRPQEELNLPLPDLLAVNVPAVDLNVPIEALGARPDVNAASFRLLSAFRNQRAARADLFPTVSIGGTLGATATSASDLFSSSFLSGLVNFTLPFLDWNRVKWNVKIAEADYEDAKLAFTKSVTTTYTIIIGFIVANLLMGLLGMLICRQVIKITKVSDAVLIPAIVVLSTIGSYSINNRMSDVYMMLIFGLVGYLCRKVDLPTAPVILGLLLESTGETGFKNAILMAKGTPVLMYYLQRPASLVLLLLIVLTVIVPAIQRLVRLINSRKKAAA